MPTVPRFVRTFISKIQRLSSQTFYYQSEEDLLMQSLQKKANSTSRHQEAMKHKKLHLQRDTINHSSLLNPDELQ